MRAHFAEYYPRSDQEVADLWSGGLVVVDSSVLLGLYEYPATVLDEFLRVLESFGERLWLPHHVGLEYHRNRLRALPQPRQSIERVLKTIADLKEKLEGLGFPEFHPTLDMVLAEKHVRSATAGLEELEGCLTESLQALPSAPDPVSAPDTVRDRLEVLFGARAGSPLSTGDFEKLRKEGEQRFAKRIPPGYKDADKDGDGRYGDLVIWRSMLAELNARADLSGLLFITNDRKEDWWLRRDNAILGPRPELVRECLQETRRLVHIYLPSDFLRRARALQPTQVSEAAVQVVERVSLQSPVRELLRIHRMDLPEPAVRAEILRAIHEGVASTRIKSAGDLGRAIESSHAAARTSYVATPLFFALVNEAYGTLTADADASVRLRDRQVRFRGADTTLAGFVRMGQVAWIAQALYRLRRGGFTRQDIVEAFFGVDAGEEESQIVAEAEAGMAADTLMRGQLAS